MNTNAKPPAPQLITPGTIAREINQPIHRVLHILTTRSAIRPAARAGRIRLYDRQAIEAVRREIARIDEIRDGSKGGDA